LNSNYIVEKLSRIGIASLAKELGDSRSENLHNLGIPFNALTLAQALFQENGYNVFKAKPIRVHVLQSFGRQEISEHFGAEGTLNELAENAANFRWGNNVQTLNFLRFLEIDPSDVFSDKSGSGDFETDLFLDKPLFDFQNEMRKGLISLFQNPSHNRIIAHMPTGSGKTRTTMEAVCDYIRNNAESENTYVVWMAHSDELCEQAVQTFEEIWGKVGCQDARIYRFWGGRPFGEINGAGATFIVTSFQTCHAAMSTSQNRKFEELVKIKANCGLLIVDEAHMSVAPTYSEAINFLSNHDTKLIGLPGRIRRHHRHA